MVFPKLTDSSVAKFDFIDLGDCFRLVACSIKVIMTKGSSGMRIEWIIEPDDILRAKAFVSEHVNKPFVQDRIHTNLRDNKPPVKQSDVWKILVGCLLTSQQRSGPNAPVSRFMRNFGLPYESCCNETNLEAFCLRILKEFGGLRMSVKISQQLAQNFSFLNDGGWKPTLAHLNEVRVHPSPHVERTAADYLADNLKGIGPKQSRNLLQWLGLSKFEIPIDSRITRWMNKFGFPVRLTANALSDRAYYCFVSEGIQRLSEACEIEPCILDAVIFVSYDGDAWTEETLA